MAASWGTWNLTTTDEDLPQDVPSTQLTGNAGSHFGVPALLGRTLIPSDAPDGQDPQPVVVLSYLFWQRHFNSDPTVIGRRLQLVHKNYTIVGVLPSRFTWEDAAVYLPLKITNDSSITFGPLIRLKPGVTHAAANAELQPLLEQFAKETPTHFPKKFRVRVQGLNEQFEEHLGQSLFLLFGAVALLLLIGCANVSILLLARGTARQHELAVRSAIGASRWRIQRQLLTEALALSLAGRAGRRGAGLSLASSPDALAAGIFVSARSGYQHQSSGARIQRRYRDPHRCLVRIWLPRSSSPVRRWRSSCRPARGAPPAAHTESACMICWWPARSH